MDRWAVVMLGLSTLVGCFEVHRVDGGGDAGACPGAPPACYFYDAAEDCCTDSGPPASCGEAGWSCPPSARSETACPSFCTSSSCSGEEPPRCVAVIEVEGRRCCDLDRSTPAVCEGSRWQCPPDGAREGACATLGVCSVGGPCEGLSLAGCLAAGCAPVFDDLCCPSCGDPFCADCVDWAFIGCEPFAERCLDGAPAPCGSVSEGFCDGDVPLCAEAYPTSEAGCSVAGCVPAVPADCPRCEPQCVPVRAESCSAICPAEPPSCPEGMVPEADGTCFTGRCIPASVCG